MTTTFLAPALPAGVVQVMDVAETTVTDVQALPPTVTAAPAAKLVPVIVIAVPPAVEPELGEIDPIVGAEIDPPGAVYVNAPVDVVVPVSLLVTTTFLAPALPAGVVQVIDVAETTVTDVQALPPTVTAAPAAKPVPVMVIAVPPAVEPELGEIDPIVGAEIDPPGAV